MTRLENTDIEQTIRRGLQADAHSAATSDAALDAILARATGARRERVRSTWRLTVPAAGVAAAVAIALVATQLGGGNGGTAWAAAALRVAEAAPRLLLAAPGWKVSRADQFSVEHGEMTFANGGRELDLFWEWPDPGFQPGPEDERLDAATVLGSEARVVRYVGTDEYRAFWSSGDHLVQLRGVAASEEEFRQLLASLEHVGVDSWLSAMPASVVRPGQQGSVVAAMLEDVPLPPGFDAAALDQGGSPRDRYQLGAVVVGAVTCGWIDEWIAARRDGDEARVATAVQAMGTSRSWPILQKMDADGDYPEVVWQYADAMAGDGTVVGGKVLTIEESYQAAFGCGV